MHVFRLSIHPDIQNGPSSVPAPAESAPPPPRRTVPARLAFLLVGGLVGCGQGNPEISSIDDTGQPIEAWQDSHPGRGRPKFRAEIRRTAYGVPHIKAKDELGLGFGIGYAYAQDNVCLLADAIVTVNGERSKFFGAAGTYPTGMGKTQVNFSSDLYHRYLNDPAFVQATWRHQPSEVKNLLSGYAAGYNRYLRETDRANLPEACRNAAWVRPLTALDLVRMTRQITELASGLNFMDALYAAQPPAQQPPADAAESSALTSSSSDGLALRELNSRRTNAQLGSNGVALGRDATASGAGMLLANPHFPWSTGLRFYQMHLTIPGKLDVMGASLCGVPLVNIGFNRYVAWTHTVNTSEHFVLYALPLDPSDPTRYMVDGQSKAMTSKRMQVEIVDANGALQTVERSYFLTEYGPVVQWNGTSMAMALRDVNFDNDRMMSQWWALNNAHSLAEFRHSVESIMGLPWVHAIATDRRGSVYYSDVTPVPDISDQQLKTCVPPGFPATRINGTYVLDGSRSACKWSSDRRAPQEGIVPSAKLPSLVRTDYVQNSNDSAWQTNPAAPLTGFPTLVSQDGHELSGRTRIGLSQIAARLAETDGLPGNRFTLESLQAIAFSNRSMSATVLLDDLKTICPSAGGSARVALEDGSEVDIAKGCAVLARWDGTTNLDSVGWPLYAAWRRVLHASSGADYYTVPFDPADPIGTPRGLRTADAAVRTASLQAVAKAMLTLDAIGIDYTRPWGELQVFARGGRTIPIHGGSDDDVYNAIDSFEPGRNGRVEVDFGSSVIWTVSFEADPPIARGFLTYSQSTDPTSPHYADQTQRFSEKDWITFPFTDEAIRADPEYTTRAIAE